MTNEKNEQLADRLWHEASDFEDRGEISAAVRLYRRSAQLGSTIAMSNLGNLLDDHVQPARPWEALYWYKRAVKRGSSTAAWNLAMHYRNLGVRRWQIHWLRVAARVGDDDAKVALRGLIRLVKKS